MKPMERGYLYAIGAAVLWGLLYTIDGKILSKMSPMNLLFVQSLLIGLVALPFVAFGNGTENLAKNRAMWPLIALTALLAVISNFWILKSIKIIGPTNASLFEISYPFFVAIFSAMLFGTHFGLPTIAGGIIIFLGSVIVIRYG